MAGLGRPAGTVIVAALLSAIICRLLLRKNPQQMAACDSALLAIAVCGLFYTVVMLKPAPELPDYARQKVVMQLHSPLVEKPRSFQALVKIENAETRSMVGKKMLIYFQKADTVGSLRIGDRVACYLRPVFIENRGNPYEFNYQQYINRKGIYYSSYVPMQNVVFQYVKSPPLLLQIGRFRELLLAKIRACTDAETFGVVASFILGYREELSDETQTRFRNAGVMHVLAVSGMHVGMLFIVLDLLFGFLKRRRGGHLMFITITLSLLWGYALLTGFAPAVRRATVMFSIFLVGSSLKRQYFPFNCLAASAFILLFFDHSLLTDPGFQLSYAAMFGILFFYNKIVQLFVFNNVIIKYLWQLIALSISAQTGTFPLSVYYFHQFPVYFIVSNLFIMPVAYIYLVFTALLLLSPIGAVSMAAGWVLNHTNALTLWWLDIIAGMPGALAKGLSVNTLQTVLLYAATGAVVAFIVFKRQRYFRLLLLLLIAFQAVALADRYSLLNRHILVVYRDEAPLIHLIDGRHNYLIYNTNEPPSPYIYENVCLHFRLSTPIMLHADSLQTDTFPNMIADDIAIQFADKLLINSDLYPCPDVKFQAEYGLTDLAQLHDSVLYVKYRQ